MSQDWTNATLSGGRYRVHSRLGEGGMGFVYKARDHNLDTDVVIKVPRLAILEDPQFSHRFQREIRSLVSLSHPHIVKILDVGEHDGVPFAVMQYLPGGDLESRRPHDPQGDPLLQSPSSLSVWLPAIARALDYVHRQHHVHRDIKPSNILFDSDDNPYLSDFGIAKVIAGSNATHHNVTATGQVIGTPSYMAPELVMGKSYDGRADQYSLAMTAYEILAGSLPFSGPTPAAILVRQATEAVPTLQITAEVSVDLACVIAKALSKDPQDRFDSCEAFAQAVMLAIEANRRASADPDHRMGSVQVPVMTRLACPACTRSLKIKAKHAGRTIKCPNCQATLSVAGDLNALLLPGNSKDEAVDGNLNTVPASSGRDSVTTPQSTANARRMAEHPNTSAGMSRIHMWMLISLVGVVTISGVIIAVLMLSPSESEKLADTARAHLLADDFDSAIACYDKAIGIDPEFTEAIYGRGLTNLQIAQELRTRSYVLFFCAFEIAPSSVGQAGVMNHLFSPPTGQLRDESKENAGEAWKQAVAKMNELNDKARRCGQLAMNDFDACIHMMPNHARAYCGRGTVAALDPLADETRAIGDLTTAIELDPDYADAYFNRGVAYSQLDTDRAIADLSKAIELNPSFADAFLHRGNVYAAKKDLSRAIADQTVAIETEPECSEAYASRADCHKENHDYGRALQDYSEAIRLRPTNPHLYGLRASVYRTMGDTAKAAADDATQRRVLAAAPWNLSGLEPGTTTHD